MTDLVHELIFRSSAIHPDAEARAYQKQTLAYQKLSARVSNAAAAYVELGSGHSDRVAVYLEKRFETVIGVFRAAAADGVFVQVNPLECTKCKGPMRIVALIEDPGVVWRILEHLGLWAPLCLSTVRFGSEPSLRKRLVPIRCSHYRTWLIRVLGSNLGRGAKRGHKWVLI